MSTSPMTQPSPMWRSTPRSMIGFALLVNDIHPGPAQAIRFGITHASAPVVVVTMADGCDDPQQIDNLVRLVERGVVIAAASRYSRGGQQVGGPALKSALSRLAGLSLWALARVGTRDATEFIQSIRCVLHPRRRHRVYRRLRDRHRTGGQGTASSTTGGGAADDMARASTWCVELQDGQLVTPLLPLVALRLRTSLVPRTMRSATSEDRST